MPRRLTKPPDVAPRCDAGRLSNQELVEARAIKLALALTVSMVHAESISEPYSPIPWHYDGRWAWLRVRLLPLAAYSPTVARICAVLDDANFSRAWYDERQMRKHLQTLARRVGILANQMAAVRAARAHSRRAQ